MFTDQDLLESLRECFVPALRQDVVAAGLVRAATASLDREAAGAGIPGVPDRYVARVTLSAPGSDDAVNAQTLASVENRLLGLPQISRLDIRMHPALFPILNGR